MPARNATNKRAQVFVVWEQLLLLILKTFALCTRIACCFQCLCCSSRTLLSVLLTSALPSHYRARHAYFRGNHLYGDFYLKGPGKARKTFIQDNPYTGPDSNRSPLQVYSTTAVIL
jgi:hypothetical protein